MSVRRTYLELSSPSDLRPFTLRDPRLRLEKAPPGSVGLFRALYRAIGAPYHWRDRLALSDEALNAYLDRPDVGVWVLREDTEAVGFFELCRHADDSVEIAYFGIVARCFGRGIGKHLLSRAVEEAWRMGASRVWLHTCTLDSPAALPNYLGRGFTPVREEWYETDVPPERPERDVPETNRREPGA